MRPHETIVTSITVTKRMTLDRAAIIELVEAHLGQKLPPDVTITITVPGGGDWSSCVLHIAADFPVTVEWKEVS